MFRWPSRDKIRIVKLFRTCKDDRRDLRIKLGRLVENRKFIGFGRYCLYFPFMRFLTLSFIIRKYVPVVKITEIFGISELITAPYWYVPYRTRCYRGFTGS